MKQELMRANGSIQHIDAIPEDIKALYKTAWELSMKDIIDVTVTEVILSISRNPEPIHGKCEFSKLTSMHFMRGKAD